MAFNVGDLLKFKPASQVNCALTGKPLLGTDGFVLVTDSLESSKRFFYGLACGTGEAQLWSIDRFDMVSAVDSKKISRRKKSES
jgi:hypothetical protein